MIKKKDKFNPKEYIKENYIDNNKVDISINIKNNNAFYDELDEKRLTLSKHIADYIDLKLKNVIYRNDVNLTFYTPSLSAEEQEGILKIIKSHYGLILFENKRELSITKIKIMILFIIGIMLLAVTHVLSSAYILIKDVLAITGWVSIWEMVTIILFDTIKIQREKRDYLRLYNAKIKFIMKVK